MQGPWDKYGSPDSGQGTLTRITPPKAPDPVQEAKEARSESRADTNTGLSVQSGERSQKGQVQDYRKEFRSSAPVKTYEIAMQSLANAVKRGEDGSGDVALIYDYAKAMDPDSVVRESEVGMAQSGQSMVDSAVARYKKEFGIEGGGALTPQLRQRLRREIINAARSRRQAYEQQREYFSDIANRSGFNPDDIVGPHIGEPYREELSHFGVSGRKFSDAEMLARQNGGTPSPDLGKPVDVGLGELGGDREIVDNSSLGPGEKWVFDDTGNRIGILGADGSFSAYGSIVDDVSQREAEEKIRREMKDAGVSQIDSSAGLYKGATANWSDELKGFGGGVRTLLTEGDFGKGYRSERDAERAMQKMSRDEYGILPELAGSLTTAVLPIGQAKTAGQLMAQGAGFGAVAGAGEGEGLADTALKATIGSGVGGATGGVISQAPRLVNSAVGQKARDILTRRPNIDRAVVDAGERQGIPIRLADAVPDKSRDLAVLESSPNVGQKVSDTLASDVEEFGKRVGGLGAPGRALDPLPRGDMLQKAGARYIARTRQKASDLYDTAKAMGGDEVVDAAPFIQDVDNRIAQLKANGEEANGGVISMLESMKRDLSGGISVAKLQAQRTTLRSRLDKAGLTMDPNQAQLNDALGVAADTLKGGLSKPGAREALSEADAFYADRQKFISGVLKHFTDRKGNIGPETAAKRFDQFLKEGGNFRVVQKIFGELEPSERATLAATAANSLGRDAKGRFSLQTFLGNIEGKNAALSSRAKFLLFGKDGVRALKDLETIARAKTAAESGFNRSRSNTTFQGGFRLRDSVMSLLGLGGAVGAGADAVPTLMATGAAYAASRGLGKIADARKAELFLNPKFTTWLKNAPDSSDPVVVGKYLDQLNKIASRDQAFLMDANAIRDFVTSQLSKSPGRAAADDETGNRRGEPPR